MTVGRRVYVTFWQRASFVRDRPLSSMSPFMVSQSVVVLSRASMPPPSMRASFIQMAPATFMIVVAFARSLLLPARFMARAPLKTVVRLPPTNRVVALIVVTPMTPVMMAVMLSVVPAALAAGIVFQCLRRPFPAPVSAP